jgi:hypothetical protein
MAEVNVKKDYIPRSGLSFISDRMWALDSRPLNIYVAAALSNQGAAARLALELQDAGFIVTSRWLRHDFSNTPTKGAWQAYRNLEIEMAGVDFEDLERSDTLIVLADVPSTHGGFHVELGAFLGAKKTNVIVVGDRPNVFFWSPCVRFTWGLKGLVDWLCSSEHGKKSDATPLRRKSMVGTRVDVVTPPSWIGTFQTPEPLPEPLPEPQTLTSTSPCGVDQEMDF